jgi:hypothetical protein
MTTTKDTLTRLFDIPKIVGDKDGKWDFQIEFYSHATRNLVGKVSKVDFAYEGNKGRMNVKAYHPGKAKDCDQWTLRLFDLRLEGVEFSYMEGRYIAGTGYMESMGYFGRDEEPEIEDGYIESCFPPDKYSGKNSGSRLTVAFTLTLRKEKKS